MVNNSSDGYYKKNKERYQNFSEEKKKKLQYGRERYINLTEHKKVG